jgi:hypothetical protein
MRKSFEVAGVSIVMLVLGWTVPACARQERQGESRGEEKPQQQAEPARHEQPQARPEQRQQQDNSPKQQPQAKGQAPTQEQNNAAKQQQQARGQQAQQQRQPQANPAQQQPQQQQANRQQNQQRQQAQQNQARQQQPQNTGRQQQQAINRQRPQRTQQAMATQRSQPALRLSIRSSGRIPDQRFRSNFGRGHEFRIGRPVLVGGYSRFQYGGYWFGFVEPWPAGWYYTDNVYIDYVDGGYYMYDPYYPGARFAISVVL